MRMGAWDEKHVCGERVCPGVHVCVVGGRTHILWRSLDLCDTPFHNSASRSLFISRRRAAARAF